MPKRTLVVLAMAAFGAMALPFGLPTIATAAPLVVGYNTINIPPQPIDQPGMLNPANPDTNTVTLCAQPLNNLHVVGTGVDVFLSIDAALFAPGGSTGGSATAGSGATLLTGTPQSFPTQATCTYDNPDGNTGTITDAVPITYTGPPSPVPANGRDVIAAESDSSSFDLSTGQCTGPGVCNASTYVYSPVAFYVFNLVPIAPTGSLGASSQVSDLTAKAEDAQHNAIPFAFMDLSLTSSAAAGGTATAVSTVNGHTTTKSLNNQATNASRFGANGNGEVAITYSTPATLPSTGVDTITAQNHPTATVESSTTYTYGAVPFSQAPYTGVTPFRVCDTRPVAPGIALNQCNMTGQGPLTHGAIRGVTIRGLGGVPSTATAVVINITAIAPTIGTEITAYPAGGTKPGTSNVNPQAGQVVANLAEVGIGTAGQIDVFNALGTVNLALDIEGYVDASATGFFHSLTPVRICDTRAVGPGIASNQCNNAGPGQHPIGPGGVLNVNVSTGSSIPTTGVVTAVVFNLTAIGPTARTVLTAYPGPLSSARPNASNINPNAKETLPNRVIVAVPTGCTTACTINIWNGLGSVNVAVDVDGWFGTATAAQFTPLPPARICDTQFGNPSDGGCSKAFVPARHSLNISIAGIDGVPPIGATHSPVAVVVNVTAVNATTATFVTVYPGPLGATQPNASDINASSFEPFTNLVIVGVGSDGSINLYNAAGNVNLIVDVFGYYS